MTSDDTNNGCEGDYQVVCYTAVFSVVTQRSSLQAREKRPGDEVVYYFDNDLSLLSEYN